MSDRTTNPEITYLRQSRDMWRRMAYRQAIVIAVLCFCLIVIAVSDLARLS